MIRCKISANLTLSIVKLAHCVKKLFRFEKGECSYNELSAARQKEERMNIRNGFNFARKVIDTGECDVLVLDEVLGLLDLEIITIEDIISLINLREDYGRLVLTGRELPAEISDYNAL